MLTYEQAIAFAISKIVDTGELRYAKWTAYLLFGAIYDKTAEQVCNDIQTGVAAHEARVNNEHKLRNRREHESRRQANLAKKQVAEVPKQYCWECNECGSQEYTMAVSETDVQELGCGGCGSDEWHKAEPRA